MMMLSPAEMGPGLDQRPLRMEARLHRSCMHAVSIEDYENFEDAACACLCKKPLTCRLLDDDVKAKQSQPESLVQPPRTNFHRISVEMSHGVHRL